MPFAKGGVVSQATPVPDARRHRPDGRGGTGGDHAAGPRPRRPARRPRATGAGAAQVTINISTPDVAGFRRSQTQIAAEMSRLIGARRPQPLRCSHGLPRGPLSRVALASAPSAGPSGGPRSSRSPTASRSGTPPGRSRAGATTRASASARSTTCTSSSPSSRRAAASSTASAGRTGATSSPARPPRRPAPLDQRDRHRRRGDRRVPAPQGLRLGRRRPTGARITKPVAGTVRVAVGGAPQREGMDWTVDAATGVVTFADRPRRRRAGHGRLRVRRAGPLRHRPASASRPRSFQAGEVPSVPVVEVRA